MARLPAAGSPSVRTSTTRWPAFAKDSASASEHQAVRTGRSPTGATAIDLRPRVQLEHVGRAAGGRWPRSPRHRPRISGCARRPAAARRPAPGARRASTSSAGRARPPRRFQQHGDQAAEREPGQGARRSAAQAPAWRPPGRRCRRGDHGPGRRLDVLQCGALGAKADQLVAQGVGQLAVEGPLGRAAHLGGRGRQRAGRRPRAGSGSRAARSGRRSRSSKRSSRFAR